MLTSSRRGQQPRKIPLLYYFFLPLPLPLAWAKSLAATLFCAFVADLLASCLPARLASFLLVMPLPPFRLCWAPDVARLTRSVRDRIRSVADTTLVCGSKPLNA